MPTMSKNAGLKAIQILATPDLHAKYIRSGGAKWLRAMIENADEMYIEDLTPFKREERNKQIIALSTAGEKHEVIANTFGISTTLVRYVTRKAGIPPRTMKPGKW